jgi:hypothetical protein
MRSVRRPSLCTRRCCRDNTSSDARGLRSEATSAVRDSPSTSSISQRRYLCSAREARLRPRTLERPRTVCVPICPAGHAGLRETAIHHVRLLVVHQGCAVHRVSGASFAAHAPRPCPSSLEETTREKGSRWPPPNFSQELPSRRMFAPAAIAAWCSVAGRRHAA